MKSYRALICGVSLALLLAVAGWTVVSLASSGALVPQPQEQQAPGHMLDPNGAQLASSATHALARVAVA